VEGHAPPTLNLLPTPDGRSAAAQKIDASQTPTATNWNVVGAGSVIRWTQDVTFPSATVP